MKRPIIILALFYYVQSLVFASNLPQFGGDAYIANQASGAMVIDGKMDEKDWEKAPLLSGFVAYPGTNSPASPTEIKILFDETHIYLGVRCSTIDSTRISTVYADGDRLERDDSLEILFEPENIHSSTYHAMVNAAGATCIFLPGKTERLTGKGFIEARTSVEKDAWILEVSINRKKTGNEGYKGRSTGFAFLRNHVEGKGRIYSAWPQAYSRYGSVKRIDLYGHVFLLHPENVRALKEWFTERIRYLKNLSVASTFGKEISSINESIDKLHILQPDSFNQVESALISLEERMGEDFWKKKFEKLFDKGATR